MSIESKIVELLPVIVQQYRIKESERSNQTMCHMCTYVPVWFLKQHLVTEGKPLVGFSCSEHVDTVLYLVGAGILNEVPPPTLETS